MMCNTITLLMFLQHLAQIWLQSLGACCSRCQSWRRSVWIEVVALDFGVYFAYWLFPVTIVAHWWALQRSWHCLNWKRWASHLWSGSIMNYVISFYLLRLWKNCTHLDTCDDFAVGWHQHYHEPHKPNEVEQQEFMFWNKQRSYVMKKYFLSSKHALVRTY